LLGLDSEQVSDYRDAVRRGDRRRVPDAVRVSAGLSTTAADNDVLVAAVTRIASGDRAPVEYQQDPHTGDFWPETGDPSWTRHDRTLGASCARG